VLQDQALPLSHQIREAVLLPKQAAKREFRRSILEAWNHCCAYCAQPAATLDHVVPKHRGGLNSRLNLVAACERCNRRKGSEDWREWYARQEHHCPERQARIERWITDEAPPIYEVPGGVQLPEG
jgi:hypothetical protein